MTITEHISDIQRRDDSNVRVIFDNGCEIRYSHKDGQIESKVMKYTMGNMGKSLLALDEEARNLYDQTLEDLGFETVESSGLLSFLNPLFGHYPMVGSKKPVQHYHFTNKELIHKDLSKGDPAIIARVIGPCLLFEDGLVLDRNGLTRPHKLDDSLSKTYRKSSRFYPMNQDTKEQVYSVHDQQVELFETYKSFLDTLTSEDHMQIIDHLGLSVNGGEHNDDH